MRKKVISLFLFTSCLLISGCKPGQLLGPKLTSTPIPTSTPLPTATSDAITDEEFSELAQEACQVFKQSSNLKMKQRTIFQKERD